MIQKFKEFINERKEGIWPDSNLSVIFQFNLDEELKKLKVGSFYVIDKEVYYKDKPILKIDSDKDGVNSIIRKIKNKLKI